MNFRKGIAGTLAGVAALAVVSVAAADVVSGELTLRRLNDPNDPPAGLTHAVMDDTYVRTPGQGGDNFGTSADLWIDIDNDRWSLIAFTNLFDVLPSVNQDGLTLQIDSATLTGATRFHGGSPVVQVHRATTNWLLKDPGDNATTVTGNHIDPDAEITWADGAFSDADYTAENMASLHLPSDPGWHAPVDFDVTALVRDMYEAGENLGFVMTNEPEAGFYGIRSSRHGTEGVRPTLSIEYSYIPEPASVTLLGAGLGLMLVRRRRTRVG